MPYKIRTLKKKETMPSEEFAEQLITAKEQFLDQPRRIWGIVIALLVIAGSVFGFGVLERHSEKKAWELESKGSQLFYKEPTAPNAEDKKEPPKVEESRPARLAKAAKIYESVLEEYPRTEAAIISEYESGNIYFELEKYDQAEARYLAFLKKRSDRKELVSLVHLKLAYLYQKKGNMVGATEQFRIGYEKKGESLNQDQAGFELARILEQQEKKTDAMAIYKKLSDEFKESPWGTEAKARLALLDPATIPPVDLMPGLSGIPGVSSMQLPAPMLPVSVPVVAPPVPVATRVKMPMPIATPPQVKVAPAKAPVVPPIPKPIPAIKGPAVDESAPDLSESTDE